MAVEPNNCTTHGGRDAEERAGRELRAAAEAGNPQAQRDLGCAYIHGPYSGWGDLPKDRALARHWYVLAAEQGHIEAMWDVADMLLDGEGGPPDIERGLRYLRFVASRRTFTIFGRNAAEQLACAYFIGQYGLAIDEAQGLFWEQRVRDHWRYSRGHKRRRHRSYQDIRPHPRIRSLQSKQTS